MNWHKYEKMTKEENSFSPIKIKVKKMKSDEFFDDKKQTKRRVKENTH